MICTHRSRTTVAVRAPHTAHPSILLSLSLLTIIWAFTTTAVVEAVTEVIQVDGANSTFRLHAVDAPNAEYTQCLVRALRTTANFWVSDIVINVQALFQQSLGGNILATGSASTLVQIGSVWYTIASAEAIEGKELNGDTDMDIVMKFSTTSWFTAESGTIAQGQYDLETVGLHELQHGLYFVGNYRKVPGKEECFLDRGNIGAYDAFVALGDDTLNCAVYGLIGNDITNDSAELYDALTSGVLKFARILSFATGFSDLHSPKTYQDLSSVYHVGSKSAGTDPLMLATIPSGQTIRTLGRNSKIFMDSVLRLSKENIAPTPCKPGDFYAKYDPQKPTTSAAPEDDTIAGLEPTTFYAIVGGVGGAILLGIIIMLVCCYSSKKKAKKHKPKGYGYMSPGGGYYSPAVAGYDGAGYDSGGAYAYDSGVASGYHSPSHGAYQQHQYNRPPFSPGMYSPARPSGRVAPGAYTSGAASPAVASPRGGKPAQRMASQPRASDGSKAAQRLPSEARHSGRVAPPPPGAERASGRMTPNQAQRAPSNARQPRSVSNSGRVATTPSRGTMSPSRPAQKSTSVNRSGHDRADPKR